MRLSMTAHSFGSLERVGRAPSSQFEPLVAVLGWVLTGLAFGGCGVVCIPDGDAGFVVEVVDVDGAPVEAAFVSAEAKDGVSTCDGLGAGRFRCPVAEDVIAEGAGGAWVKVPVTTRRARSCPEGSDVLRVVLPEG
jgi:hypothetical protein